MSYNIEPIHVHSEHDELIDEFYAADFYSIISVLFDVEADFITVLTVKRILEEFLEKKKISLSLYNKIIKQISDKYSQY